MRLIRNVDELVAPGFNPGAKALKRRWIGSLHKTRIGIAHFEDACLHCLAEEKEQVLENRLRDKTLEVRKNRISNLSSNILKDMPKYAYQREYTQGIEKDR